MGVSARPALFVRDAVAQPCATWIETALGLNAFSVAATLFGSAAMLGLASGIAGLLLAVLDGADVAFRVGFSAILATLARQSSRAAALGARATPLRSDAHALAITAITVLGSCGLVVMATTLKAAGPTAACDFAATTLMGLAFDAAWFLAMCVRPSGPPTQTLPENAP